MSNFSLRGLMKNMIYTYFYDTHTRVTDKPGLLWADDSFGDKGHNQGLVVTFLDYSANKELHLLIYSGATYPLVAAAWTDRFTRADTIRNWCFISKHDASVREAIDLVLTAVDELDISSLGSLSSGFCVETFSQETRDYLKTLNYTNCKYNYEQIKNYLMSGGAA